MLYSAFFSFYLMFLFCARMASGTPEHLAVMSPEAAFVTVSQTSLVLEALSVEECCQGSA